jgi:hypothetical protein
LNKTLLISLVGAITSLTVPSLSATTLLNPGATLSPDVFSGTSAYTGLTFVASTGQQTITTPTFTANYTEWVYRWTTPSASSPGPALCFGCLDFFIELTNVSGDAVQSISTGSFVGFNTAAGYNTAAIPGINGGVAVTGVVPNSADRSVSGATDRFNFQTTNIAPGQSSALLEIQTDATNYVSSFVSAQDSTAGSGPGFAPTSAPEPGTMAMLGLGLIGLGMAKINRNKKSA